MTGVRWFLLFVDDHTRLSLIYMMKQKSETSNLFKTFHKMVQTQFDTSIQIIHTDNARDYFNSELGDFFKTHGIIHSSSCV
ncbi:transposase family protein, partial [Erysipelatoclostridium ramosum]|uniref:integrase catalytic domain-containing protein n=1 Tax=Thomasclavelia ramosa TaxID=1547 RepID=UPI001D079079|nr:transposase family protein [Thomasclavelia ramosa]